MLALKGALRGFFREAFGLLALSLGIGVSVLLGSRQGQNLAVGWQLDAAVARAIAHAILFLIPYIALQTLGYVLHRLGRTLFLGGLDRLVGAFFGALTGVLLSGAALSLLLQWDRARGWIRGSQLAGLFVDLFLRCVEWSKGIVP